MDGNVSAKETTLRGEQMPLIHNLLQYSKRLLIKLSNLSYR